MHKILQITGLVVSLLISGNSFGQSWEKYLDKDVSDLIADGKGGAYFVKWYYFDWVDFHYNLYHIDRFGNIILIKDLGRNQNIRINSIGEVKSVSYNYLNDTNKQQYIIENESIILLDEQTISIDTLKLPYSVLSFRHYNGSYLVTGSKIVENDTISYISEVELKGNVLWTIPIHENAFNLHKAVKVESGILVYESHNKEVLKFDMYGEVLWSKPTFPVNENFFLVDSNYVIIRYNDNLDRFSFEGELVDRFSGIGSCNLFDNSESESSVFVACTTGVQIGNSYYSYILRRIDWDKTFKKKRIQGFLYEDLNDNCQYDEGEKPIPGVLVYNEPLSGYSFTDSTGHYSIPADSNIEYIVKPSKLGSKFRSLECFEDRQVTILPDDQVIENIDFPIHEELCPQLKLSYSRSTYNRCFPGHHNFFISNVGTETTHDVQAEIAFPKEIITKSVSGLYTIEDGVYKFNLSSLAPGEKIEIVFQDSIDCRAWTGTVSGFAKVYTSSTCTLIENSGDSLGFSGWIRGSYDPNDKSVFPTRINFSDYTNGLRSADFHINFQNTGDGPAYKVVVVDTISPDLEFEGIADIQASHPYNLQVLQTDPMVLAWSFVGINLPGKEENKPESHGFISFSMPLKENLSNNSVVENRAAIYFDFNDPIITNTASITISDEVNTDSGVITSTKAANLNPQIHIYPNPVNGSANIILPEIISLPCTFSLINNQGIKVKENKLTTRENLIQTENLPSGLYHYQVNDDEKVFEGNLVVK